MWTGVWAEVGVVCYPAEAATESNTCRSDRLPGRPAAELPRKEPAAHQAEIIRRPSALHTVDPSPNSRAKQA